MVGLIQKEARPAHVTEASVAVSKAKDAQVGQKGASDKKGPLWGLDQNSGSCLAFPPSSSSRTLLMHQRTQALPSLRPEVKGKDQPGFPGLQRFTEWLVGGSSETIQHDAHFLMLNNLTPRW